MKKIISLVLLFIIICSPILFADPIVYQGTISVTTTTAIARNRKVNRRKLIFENTTKTYDIYLATYPISYANRANGDRVVANGGSWNDENYWVYVSTWYVVSDSGTITLQYKESE